MKTDFKIDKIASYLSHYKKDLQNMYKWSAPTDKLINLKVISENEAETINKLKPFDKEIKIKERVGEKLKQEQKSNPGAFIELCKWVVKDWGGIKGGKDQQLAGLITTFLKDDKPSFERIASTSKVGSLIFPEKYIIYDSRVTSALNWIILSENAGKKFFPIPSGRNSKLSAFDMSILIRLKNISTYKPESINSLDNKKYISNNDSNLFIDKDDSYNELCQLIKEVNQQLWKGEPLKRNRLYYTEMLLYSLADKQIFIDIVSKCKLKLKKHTHIK
jgi:hypothetical protein